MPHEPFYDVPSDGGYALIFASFFSLVLAGATPESCSRQVFQEYQE